MNSLKKVLILGGTGMVGGQCDWPNTVKYDSKDCDITDYKQVVRALQKEQSSIVVLLAAKCDLQWCENNPIKAVRVNIIGTLNVAMACREYDIKLVFMSTTAIFPNDIMHELHEDKIPLWFPEDIVEDAPNVYGKTKLIGEQIVRQFCPDALIIRPGRMFGGGKKYDKKRIRQCYEALSQGKVVKGCVNHYCSLIYIPDLWWIMKEMIESGIHGIVHIANNGAPVTLFEVYKFIQEKGKLGGEVVPETVEQGSGGYIATINQSIDSSIKLRTWQEAMIKYLEVLKNEI